VLDDDVQQSLGYDRLLNVHLHTALAAGVIDRNRLAPLGLVQHRAIVVVLALDQLRVILYETHLPGSTQRENLERLNTLGKDTDAVGVPHRTVLVD